MVVGVTEETELTVYIASGRCHWCIVACADFIFILVYRERSEHIRGFCNVSTRALQSIDRLQRRSIKQDLAPAFGISVRPVAV